MCDDALGSDMEGSETDSKVSDSKRNGDGKSQGGSSKPRRLVYKSLTDSLLVSLKAVFCSQSPDCLHLRTARVAGEQIQNDTIFVGLRKAKFGAESESDGDASKNMVNTIELAIIKFVRHSKCKFVLVRFQNRRTKWKKQNPGLDVNSPTIPPPSSGSFGPGYASSLLYPHSVPYPPYGPYFHPLNGHSHSHHLGHSHT